MIESMFAAGEKIKQEREVRYTYLSLFTIFSKNKTTKNEKENKRSLGMWSTILYYLETKYELIQLII